MKKKLLTMIILLIAIVHVYSQADFFVGAATGINYSTMKFSAFQNEYSANFGGGGYVSDPMSGFQMQLRAGVKFRDKFQLLLEPTIIKKSFQFGPRSVTQEITRGGYNNYSQPLEGFRTWQFKVNAVHVPLMLRYKLFGGRWGVNLASGLSYNITLGGDFFTGFATINDAPFVNDNPIYLVSINPGEVSGYINYSEEYPRNGDKIRFGKQDLDHFNKNDISFIGGLQTYYNLNAEGKIRLTFDFRYDIGLTNLYSNARVNYLKNINGTTEVIDIDDSSIRFDIIRRPVFISGTQKMRSTIFSVGIEFCPSCTY